jgi:CRAL/TRIO domain
MVILNAPSFFVFFWRIIKTMLDARTASKVVMFSNERDGIKWMHERIDKGELMSDYGGDGDSFETVMNQQNVGSSAKRQVVKLFSISQKTNRELTFALTGDEKADFKVYTRSAIGAGFELTKGGSLVEAAAVEGSKGIGTEGSPVPIQVTIFKNVQGPGHFVIKSKAKSAQLDHFVVAGDVF